MNKQLSLISWIKNGFLVIVMGMVLGLGFCAWQVRSNQKIAAKGHTTEHLRYQARSLFAEALQSGQSLRNAILNPSDKKAFENHEIAVKNCTELTGQIRAELKTIPETETLLPDIGQIEEQFEKLYKNHEQLLKLAASGDSAGANRMLVTEETPLWRKTKETLNSFGEKVRVIR